MKRAVVIAFLALSLGEAHAQPVTIGWRPPTGCASNDVIKWNGTAWTCGVVSSFTTSNVIPKGNGTGLTASSLTDNGSSVFTALSGYVGLDTGTGTKIFNVGRDTTLSTNAQNGYSVTTYSDGNLYIDHKTYSNGTVTYRFGGGASSGAAFNWFTLNTNGGLTTFDRGLSVNGNTTLGDADTDTFNVRGYAWVSRTGVDSVPFVRIQNDARVWDLITDGANADRFVLFDNTSGLNVMIATAATAAVAFSGNVTLGDATSDNHTINGATVLNGPPGATDLVVRDTNASKTVSDLVVGNFQSAGSFDTTGGAKVGYAGYFEASSTRSAGANNVVNRAIHADAYNGQVNTAIETYRGDNNFNTSSGASTFYGNVAIGDAPADTLSVGQTAAPTAINSGSSLFSSTAPKVEILTGTSNTGYNEAVVIRHSGVSSTTATHRLGLLLKLSTEGSSGESAKSGGLVVESVAAFANSPSLYLVGNDAKRLEVNANGSLYMGDTTNTSIADNVDVLTIGNTGTGQTADGTRVVNVTNSGTYDTTAGAIFTLGLRSVVSSSRSAGANSLTNIALYGNAVNGQVNVALQTDNGDVLLNQSGGSLSTKGNATFGDSSLDTVTVTGDLTVSDTTTLNNTTTVNIATGSALAINALVQVATASGATSSEIQLNNAGAGNSWSFIDSASGELAIKDATASAFRMVINNSTGDVSIGQNDLTTFAGKLYVNGSTKFGGANTDTMTVQGHLKAQGTAPTLSSCGTSPTVGTNSNDHAGFFTTGTGATACTLTFSRTFTNEPACVIVPAATATNPTCTSSATAMTCSTVAASTKYKYVCIEL